MSAPHPFLLFDLDGTLSDPLVGIGRSINFALEAFGFPTKPLPELAQYVGPPLDETFSVLTGLTGDLEIRALVARFRECYGEVGYSENVLYPGIAAAIAALADGGVPMGICTTKRGDFADRILRMFELRGAFRFISGGDLGIQKGQQIETLLGSGTIDGRTLMIGDRATDLVAAHRNGLRSAGVLWGYGSRAELEAEAPLYLLEAPEDMLRLPGEGV